MKNINTDANHKALAKNLIANCQAVDESERLG